jgi:hypothetical protein
MRNVRKDIREKHTKDILENATKSKHFSARKGVQPKFNFGDETQICDFGKIFRSL